MSDFRPPSNRGRHFAPEPLTETEARALLRAPSSSAPTGVRNRALIAAMYGAGLRLSEALDLKAADVDFDGNLMRVLDGKGHKPRTVSISDAPLGYVARWVEVRRREGLRSRFLFCTLTGHRLQPRYVRNMLARMGERAGIEKRVHPHGLRHTFTAKLDRDGWPTGAIRDQLGHRSLAVTDRYLGLVSPSDRVTLARQQQWEV